MATSRLIALASLLILSIGTKSDQAYAAEACIQSANTLCLVGSRFQVELTHPASQTVGGVNLSADSGAFWFFEPTNLEVAVKILDGSSVNHHFWVFHGGLSDRPYTIEITDTATGISRMYHNSGGKAVSEGDIDAFPSTLAASSHTQSYGKNSKLSVNAEDLHADFSAEPLGPSDPSGRSVKFVDQSSGSPDFWCWTFGLGSGTACELENQGPKTINYPEPGTYTVRLIVSRINGPTQTISEITKTVTVPFTATCSYQFTPTQASFSADGGSGMVSIAASEGCHWNVVSDNDFLQITSLPDGSSINYDVTANPDHLTRKGTLRIEGTNFTFAVTQDPAPCTYEFIPSQPPAPFPAEIKSSSKVTVKAPKGCTWKVVSDKDFLHITSPPNGEGHDTGDVMYDVAANLDDHSPRAGSLSLEGIADLEFSVSQDGASCTFTISPTSQEDFPGDGGSGAATVKGPLGCDWTAESQSPFITIDLPTETVVGPGSVSYTVTPNPDTSRRKGTLLIAGKTFTLTQIGCASFDPPQQSIEGTSGSVEVTAPDSCTWEASSDSPFLTITSGSSGSGRETMSYSFSGKVTSLGRTGTLRIVEETFQVLQSCASIVGPTRVDLPAEEDPEKPVTVTVKAPSGCNWIAESNVDESFITIKSGVTGSGDGTVTFSVKSTENEREGTLSIAGHTFTVHQNGSPLQAFCIPGGGQPEISDFSSLGGLSSLQVVARAGCSWTAKTDSTFLKFLVKDASGQGNGTVPFCVAANRHVQRNGDLAVSETETEIKKALFQITQEAPKSGDPAACSTDALCLGEENRFEVRMTFTFSDDSSFGGSNNPGRAGYGFKLSDKTGYFSFSEGGDPELVVKVLDGRTINCSFWVYSGALTDRSYVVTVTDRTTGRKTFFCNVKGSFQSFADTMTLTSPPPQSEPPIQCPIPSQ